MIPFAELGEWGIRIEANITIQHIESELFHLATVKALGKANQHTLGLFPDGAFDDYAHSGTILVAIDQSSECVGYLLYRCTRQQVTVVHLCVEEQHRGAGIGRKLVESLISHTRDYRGIGLKCRRDYPANDLWPKLGFSVLRELPGRSKKGTLLIHWWRTHHDTNLFSDAAGRLRESKICAVMDANILFDLMEPESQKTLPSKSLEADWLEDSIELCVTEEIFNEINRQKDTHKRKKSHNFASEYTCLPSDNDGFDSVLKAIRGYFPVRLTDRGHSDLRQLARAINAHAPYFVTRDSNLIKLRERIEEAHGMVILQPAGLIGRLDELQRGEAYRPAFFSGTALTVRLLAAGQAGAIWQTFLQPGEKLASLNTRLDCALADPQTYRCEILQGRRNEPLALTITSVAPHEFRVHLLRVKRGPLAFTLALQMVRQTLLSAIRENVPITRILDLPFQQEIEPALSYFWFAEDDEGWAKIGPAVVENSKEMASRLQSLSQYAFDAEGLYEWANLIEEDPAGNEPLLWPAKLTDASIQNYLVPIKPQWAQELFDENLAAQSLYGRKEELALNVEGVYYRSARPAGIEAPARILWYITEQKGFTGTKQIRACSRLLSVKVGTPKELFKEYQRLGIYEWKDVYRTAGKDVSKKIMALHFADTELFPRPITLKRLRKVMDDLSCPLQLQSPHKVPPEVFIKLYAEAIR